MLRPYLLSQRPERFPERGLKGRSRTLSRNDGTASDRMKPSLARQDARLRLFARARVLI